MATPTLSLPSEDRSDRRRDPGPRTTPPSDVGRSGRGWTLAATSLGFGVVQLDVSVVNVAIRPIGADVGGSIAALQWVVTAYTLTFAALILSAGALGDRIGARRVFVSGFALFTAASAVCGLAPGIGVLIGARAVQGIGAAALVPSSLKLLHHAYPGAAERARAVGVWAASASVALAAGPLAGGLLTAAWGWRAIFFINAPLGLAGIWLTARRALETPRATARGLDAGGQVLAVVMLAALAGATIAGGEHGFGAPLVLAGYGVAALAGAAFVTVEARSRRPMLPLRLFRSRSFSAATGIGLLINLAVYGLLFVLSLYFQTVLSYGVLGTGLAFAPTMFAIGAGNLLAGRLTARLGTRVVLAASGGLVTASLAGLLGIGAATGYAAIVVQLALLGVGIGLLVPPMTAAVLSSAPATHSGVASGALTTARQAGSVVGVALFGSLAAGHLVTGLRTSLVVSVALCAAVIALAVVVEKEPA